MEMMMMRRRRRRNVRNVKTFCSNLEVTVTTSINIDIVMEY